jgi:hypothetical protein
VLAAPKVSTSTEITKHIGCPPLTACLHQVPTNMALSAESEWPVIEDEMIIIDGKACNE